MLSKLIIPAEPWPHLLDLPCALRFASICIGKLEIRLKRRFTLSNARLIVTDILFWQDFSSFICSALSSGFLVFLTQVWCKCHRVDSGWVEAENWLERQKQVWGGRAGSWNPNSQRNEGVVPDYQVLNSESSKISWIMSIIQSSKLWKQ